jgi:hypothetical protein
MSTTENQIEQDLIAKLVDLKYTLRPDLHDRAALEKNFREKFEALNRVHLTDSEFQRLLDSIITPDVYNAAQTLRNMNAFERDDGTPLNYTLVNIKDWLANLRHSTSLPRSSTICAFKTETMQLQPTTRRLWAYGDCCWEALLSLLSA